VARRSKRKSPADDPADGAEQGDAPKTAKQKTKSKADSESGDADDSRGGGRFSWLGPAFLVLVGGGLWFAPEVVARTHLRETALRHIVPAEFAERLHLGTVSAGWLTGIRADNVVVRGEGSTEPLRIRQLELQQPLWKLLLDSRDLGKVVVTEPTITSEVRPGGSTLEDALAPLFEGEGGALPAGRLIVHQGTISLSSQMGTRVAKVDDLELDFRWPRGVLDPTELEGSGVISDGERTGRLSLSLGDRPLTLKNSETPTDPVIARSVTLNADAVPLAALIPLFDRAGLDAELSGDFSSKLTGAAVPPTVEVPATLRAAGEINLERLVARGGPLADGDRLSLAKCRLAGEVAAREGRVQFRDASLSSDIAGSNRTSS